MLPLAQQKASWVALLCFTLAPGLALAGSGRVIFEIKHQGGYRDPASPDPYIVLRVQDDGRMGCHCNDRQGKHRWVEGRVSKREVEQLSEKIQESGFFDLRGGLSRWQAWWYAWQSDAGVSVYSAAADGKKKTYRYAMDFFLGRADKPETALSHLDEAVRPFRERLCGPEPKPASND